MLVYSSQSVTRRGEMALILPRFIEDVQENYRIPRRSWMQITISLKKKKKNVISSESTPQREKNPVQLQRRIEEERGPRSPLQTSSVGSLPADGSLWPRGMR